MSTYGAMQDRIADELARTDLTANIRQAIQSSIRHYERERFYFNETRQTFTTSSGAEYYTSADYPFIARLAQIDTVRITVSGTHWLLLQRDWEDLDEMQTNTSHTGDPTDFAYYGQQIRLYPVPNAARTVVVSGLEKATTLSATTDTNYWMTDAEELIRSRATRKIYSEVIKNAEQASYWVQCEMEALGALKGETDTRLGTGQIRPVEF